MRRAGGARRAAKSALAALDLPSCAGRTVLLKPNAGRAAASGSGIVTSAEVVAGAAEFFRDAGAAEVWIGESPILGVNVEEAFRVIGLDKIAEETGAKLIDMDRARPVVVPIPDGRAVKEVKLCAAAVNADLVVSIPVMKTHMHTRVTLSVKNMKGAMWRREKVKFHQLDGERRGPVGDKMLETAIADLATAAFPDVALIDGIVGMEGLGPSAGAAKRLGVVVESADALAADAVACRLMGLRAAQVPHLRLAAERGLGVIDLRRIRVDPADYHRWADRFEPPPKRLNLEFPRIALHQGEACSACTSTLMLFLQQYYDKLGDYALADGKTHVAIGIQDEALPPGAIALGNCAAIVRGGRAHERVTLVRGCPPVCSQVLAALGMRMWPNENLNAKK